jgi:hypothetical protein
MDPGRAKRLEELAGALDSASGKLDAGLPLAEGEVRMLRAVHAAAPREPRLRVSAPVLAAAAAALLIAGFFAASYLVSPGGGDSSPILLSMAPAEGTRSGAGWREGDPFVLQVTLPEDLHLLVVHVDAAGKLDLVFPFHDAATGAWSHLGHASSRLPGGSPVSIPAPGFPMNLRIEGGGAGEELFLAFAGREPIGEAELPRLRDELRRAVDEARRANAGSEAIVERLRSVVAGKAGEFSGFLRYRVARP